MKSRRLVFYAHGSPSEVLELGRFDLAALGEGQVLLRIEASPINPADLNFIQGNYGVKPELPAFPGMECVATVLESRSEKFFAGDFVIPFVWIGAWAEYVVVEAENLIRVPSGIDLLQAAMLKVNPATAWLLLRHFTKWEQGDWVVFNAANSGVGQCLIPFASKMGLKTLGFSRSSAHFGELKALGVNAIVCDTAEGLAEAREILGNQKARLALNSVGGESALRLAKLLAAGATHVTYGAMSKKPLILPNGMLIFEEIEFRGFWLTKWLQRVGREEVQALYEELAGWVLRGDLAQRIDRVFSLPDFSHALSCVSAPDRSGKILLKMH